MKKTLQWKIKYQVQMMWYQVKRWDSRCILQNATLQLSYCSSEHCTSALSPCFCLRLLLRHLASASPGSRESALQGSSCLEIGVDSASGFLKLFFFSVSNANNKTSVSYIKAWQRLVTEVGRKDWKHFLYFIFFLHFLPHIAYPLRHPLD